MGLADEFERRLERVVEGFFSKAFRSKVEPAEIGRRLMREMESGKSVSVAAIYVPNRYEIRLSAIDYERLEGLMPTLRSEFALMLKTNASERRWRPAGGLEVSFVSIEDLAEGRFQILAEHDASIQSPPPEVQVRPTLLIADADPPRRWVVETDRAVIGRLEECDLVLADPNVSRRHAEISRRDDGWWITDLDATNGTLVNETLVKERRLRSGDLIRIGDVEIKYQQSDREGGDA